MIQDVQDTSKLRSRHRESLEEEEEVVQGRSGGGVVWRSSSLVPDAGGGRLMLTLNMLTVVRHDSHAHLLSTHSYIHLHMSFFTYIYKD